MNTEESNNNELNQNQEENTEFSQNPVTNEAHEGEANVSVDQYKVLAIVGYVLPILFFIPLVTEGKHNKFARFHANQQLNLLLFWVIGQMAASFLMIALIGIILLPLVIIAGVVFMIMGIINASNGTMKPLPLIGKIELIK